MVMLSIKILNLSRNTISNRSRVNQFPPTAVDWKLKALFLHWFHCLDRLSFIHRLLQPQLYLTVQVPHFSIALHLNSFLTFISHIYFLSHQLLGACQIAATHIQYLQLLLKPHTMKTGKCLTRKLVKNILFFWCGLLFSIAWSQVKHLTTGGVYVISVSSEMVEL